MNLRIQAKHLTTSSAGAVMPLRNAPASANFFSCFGAGSGRSRDGTRAWD